MDEDSKPAEDYTVGYGKPPLHSRFKKGQKSANPHGRPTASRSTSTIWREILDRPLKDNVVTAETNSREALLIKAFHEAYNGKLHNFERLGGLRELGLQHEDDLPRSFTLKFEDDTKDINSWDDDAPNLQ